MAQLIKLPSFAAPGDQMIFRNSGGYDIELKRAQEVFEEGKTYTVSRAEIGRSSSTYTFEGIKGSWNTVMFFFADPKAILAEDEVARADRRAAYNESQTYTYWNTENHEPLQTQMREYIQTLDDEFLDPWFHDFDAVCAAEQLELFKD